MVIRIGVQENYARLLDILHIKNFLTEFYKKPEMKLRLFQLTLTILAVRLKWLKSEVVHYGKLKIFIFQKRRVLLLPEKPIQVSSKWWLQENISKP